MLFQQFMQQLQEKSGLIEAPCLRAAGKSELVKPEILSLQERSLEKDLTLFTDAFHHKLTPLTYNYRQDSEKLRT